MSRRLVLYPEKYDYYGVEWITTNATTIMKRVGNLNYHHMLPVHSMMRRCLLLDDGTVNYYTHPDDTKLKTDGVTPSVLDGTDGQVMVEIPEHWRKHEKLGVIERTLIAHTPITGFTRIPRSYVSAYEATVQRSTNKLASVATTDPDYRGGNNASVNDANSNTLLGKPASSLNRPTFRTLARNRGSIKWNMMLHEVRKTIFWLYYVEYANMNCQTAFDATLDALGFRQGGLGRGVTTVDPLQWSQFGYYGFVNCGTTNNIGNNTGVVNVILPWATIGNVDVPSYRGVENVFGHLWEWTDGVNVNIQSNSSGGLSEVYIADTLAMSDSNNIGYTKVGNSSRNSGYIQKILFNDGEILPTVTTGASTSTFWCDNYYTSIPSSGASIRGVISSGGGSDGQSAGLAISASSRSPSHVESIVGTRLCYLPEGV